MRKIICIVILIFLWMYVHPQSNLVPNPSFEDTVGSCVSSPNEILKARYWKDFSASVDYYNSCSNPSQFGVPYNINGYQKAASGVAYVGFAACYDTVAVGSLRNIREHFGAKLTQTLTIGQKYFVSLKVVPTENGCWSCNKIGVKFTTFDTNFPQMTNNPLANNISQVYAIPVITDTINWTTIKGSFVADSAYTYIVVGNFFKDNVTQTASCTTTGGYYLADDICVSTDSIYASTWTNINESTNDFSSQNIKLYPQPASDILNIELISKPKEDFNRVATFNNLGQLIREEEITFINRKASLNISDLGNGVYFITITNQNHESITKKLVVTH
jgi:hypothetical protein